ncbi:MAG: hypothetical protein HY606_15255 [Planctomycetes bacterium]|nr:hypothetical protein [Planctomycetota bacterium]
MIKIKLDEFISSIDKKQLLHKVIICSKNYKDQITQHISKSEYIIKKTDSLNLEVFAQFTFTKMIVLCDVDLDLSTIREFTFKIPGETCLLIMASKIDKRFVLLDNITVISDDDFSLTQKNIQSILAAEQIELDQKNTAYLTDLLEHSFYPWHIELEKIINYLKAGGNVPDLYLLVKQKEEFDIFGIIGLLLNGKKEDAVFHLKSILDSSIDEGSKKTTPLVIGSILWFLRKIAAIKAFKDPIDLKELSSKLSIRYDAQKYLNFSRRTSYDHIKESIRCLEQADLLSKTTSENITPILFNSIYYL